MPEGCSAPPSATMRCTNSSKMPLISCCDAVQRVGRHAGSDQPRRQIAAEEAVALDQQHRRRCRRGPPRSPPRCRRGRRPRRRCRPRGRGGYRTGRNRFLSRLDLPGRRGPALPGPAACRKHYACDRGPDKPPDRRIIRAKSEPSPLRCRRGQRTRRRRSNSANGKTRPISFLTSILPEAIRLIARW